MKARVVCLLRGCPAAITTQVLRQKKREKADDSLQYELFHLTLSQHLLLSHSLCTFSSSIFALLFSLSLYPLPLLLSLQLSR